MSNASLKFLVSRFPRRSGSALLLILGCVALLTIVILAFFSQARSEAGTSNFYARQTSTKLLSENVINLVEAQLREGARSSDLITNQPVAWVSQPGMIRTYDNLGKPHQFFKLYSSDSMNGTLTVPFNGNSDAPVAGWGVQRDIYTDLNEPITAGGNTEYPIIDPSILNSVDGFSFTAQTETGISNTLPMPVKWLYVLKNGSLVTATSSGGGAVSIPTSNASNPVVGRVAFWTDDESSKVNINTASEGTFWDVPIAANNEDYGNPTLQAAPYGYSSALPAGTEYQRIPGHPATTCLSPIFGYGTTPVLPDNSLVNWPLTTGNTGTYTTKFAPYYSITPRYAAGGSMGGAQPPFTNANFSPSNYRLFDSIDELAFDPTRTALTNNPPALPALYPNANPASRTALGITPQVINTRRFFLTAHSRAPEETLFGTPRVSLWPLQAQTTARTAKDSLLAFCSTINNQPFYFQRATYFQMIPSAAGPTSTTNDAFGNPSSSSQSTTQDFPDAPTPPGTTTSKTGVQRNEDIYGYLQALTSQNIPGFGGNFLAKYPGANGTSDRDEILTEMFDLIRCGVNTINLTPGLYPNYSYTLYPANLNNYSYPGAGSAVPIAIETDGGTTGPNTHGLGRTYNVAEVALGFMASDVDLSPSAAGALDSNSFIPSPPRRISIGVGLPWACEEDYWPSKSIHTYMYYDLATGAYGDYYLSTSVTLPPVTTAYIYPPTVPPVPVPLNTSHPVPIFCYWDTATSQYGSYFVAPVTAPNAGKLFICASPTNPPATGYVSPGPPAIYKPLPATAVTIGDPQTKRVQSYLIIRPYSLLTGFPISMPKVRIRVTGLDNLSIDGQPLGFPASNNAVEVIDTENNTSEYTGGGVTEAYSKAGAWPPPSGSTTGPGQNDGTNESYPFISSSILMNNVAYPSPYGGEDVQPALTNGNPPTSKAAPTIFPPTPVQIHSIVSDPFAAPTFAATSMMLNGGQLKVEVFDGMAPTIAQAQLLQTVYVTIPPMTLPVPSIEMAGSAASPEAEATEDGDGNAAGGPRLPGFTVGLAPPNFGVPSASTYVDGPTAVCPNKPYSTSYPALAYYYQLDYNPLSIASRLTTVNYYGSGYQRLMNRGDTIRSFVVNPFNHVCGDMRLLAANPFENPGTSTGTSNDVFVPLGQGQSTWTGSALSSYTGAQQPYTSLFVRQMHSLGTDAGDGVTLLPLIYSWIPSPPVGNAAPVPYTSIGALNPKNRNSSYGGSNETGVGQTNGSLFEYPVGTSFTYPDGVTSGNLEHSAPFSAPAVTPELQGAFMDGATSNKFQGDWSNGVGPSSDGPFIFKPDEGVQDDSVGTYSSNYYQTNQNLDKSLSSYSPNRQVQSAVMFGGLPSIVYGGLYPWSPPNSGGVPWCTLLFCPNPACNDGNVPHPGFGVGSGTQGATDIPPYSIPPDHLLLDLFWMPVVDPYAISEPFSTAGKINLNYEIVPFGNYIHRSTALHAVMKSTRILAIPTEANDGNLPPPPPPQNNLSIWPDAKAIYINVDNPQFSSGAPDFSYRYNINLPATIDDFYTNSTNGTSYLHSQFYNRFVTEGDLFRSASEICNIFLVPKKVPGYNYFYNPGNGLINPSNPLPTEPADADPGHMETWWANFKLTGDNSREMPYKYLYPRLTTKSNTFQVHMRVQVVTQTTADSASGTFNSAAGDSVTGEYRGSAIIERYVDPNQTTPTTLPDFAVTFPANPTGLTSTVDSYVRYRVVSMHAFSP